MDDRRNLAGQPAPDYEDRGLFKAPPIRVVVAVTPLTSSNRRGDIVVHGFVSGEISGERPVEILFAGRRKATARPLLARLDAMYRRAVQQARMSGDQPPPAQSIRVTICAYGSWRIRGEKGADGWQSRKYQFVVARWALPTTASQPRLHGELPLTPRPPE